MTKKILAIIFALLMLMTVAACGGEEGAAQGGDSAEGFVLKGNDADEYSVALGNPDVSLNPADVYSKLTYTPEMFFGNYRIKGGSEAENQFGLDYDYNKVEFGDEERNITVVPFRIEAGKETLMHKVSNIEEYDWARLYFMRYYSEDAESALLDSFLCAYTVEGNKITFKPLDKFEVDDEANTINYSFHDTELVYEFAFKGRTLTLKSGSSSVDLMTGLDAYGTEDYFCVENYLTKGSKTFSDVSYFNFRYDDGDTRFNIEKTNEEDTNACVGKLTEDGLFTFTYLMDNGTMETCQYVYFYCGNDGLVLTNGTDTYYFNETYSDHMCNQVNKYLTEDQTGKLEGLSETELEVLVQKTEDLMAELEKAFSDAGITVTVNAETGEMAMEASVLFDGDSAVLKAEGKELLDKFVKAYTEIVFSEEYEGFIQKTLVEGHTAPVTGDTYEDGYPLSVERAENVKNYCVSMETGVDTSKLADSLEAVGCSNVQPVKDENGVVDMDASRRVSFRFIINIG